MCVCVKCIEVSQEAKLPDKDPSVVVDIIDYLFVWGKLIILYFLPWESRKFKLNAFLSFSSFLFCFIRPQQLGLIIHSFASLALTLFSCIFYLGIIIDL